MTITFTGVQAAMTNGGGTSYQAKDGQGNTVAVQASDEAIKDHGATAVQQKAKEKFDAGTFTENNGVRIVTVRNTDF